MTRIAEHTVVKTCAIVFFLCGVVSPVFGDWRAGRDLLANEKPDGPQELINPNPTVPAWSYGTRTALLSTSLQLFTAAQHFNAAIGSEDMEGFSFNASDVLVNTGAGPFTPNFGAGPLDPIAPGEIFMSPGAAGEFGIVRWTAPAAGLYGITASWDDADHTSGDGASAHIVVNGAQVFIQAYANGGGASTTQNLLLGAGDLLDFAIGANGTFFADDVRFSATINAIPEPGSASAFTAGLLILAGRYRLCRRERKRRSGAG